MNTNNINLFVDIWRLECRTEVLACNSDKVSYLRSLYTSFGSNVMKIHSYEMSEIYCFLPAKMKTVETEN